MVQCVGGLRLGLPDVAGETGGRLISSGSRALGVEDLFVGVAGIEDWLPWARALHGVVASGLQHDAALV